jgi:cyclopropane-fatty-acyl-phospholipid synthase
MKNNTVAEINTTVTASRHSSMALLAREAVKKRLANMADGTIMIRDPRGEWFAGVGNRIDATVTVHDMRFYQQILTSGTKGAAAAWRDGLWSCPDLTTLLRIMTRNIESLDAFETGTARLMNFWETLKHRLRSNTRKGSQENIHAHYDLGNDMFELFLDRTMTYSAGIFRQPDATLEQASIEKLDTICRKLELNASHHLIEIGSGWGSFAIHAATHYGCKVTTTTISKDQYKLASERIAAAGLQDRITLLLCDYRDLEGQYDRLVSIEMIEAVGHEFLPRYFSKCASLLKNDGRMLIQAITMPDQRYAQYLKRTDFIQQFIFPGSCVPSLTAMLNAATTHTDLRIEHIENIGPDYATTLHCWLDNFRANRERISALGYDEKFMRIWEYYLCYCEAGFRERYLGDVHLLMHKPQAGRLPLQVAG